jgi:hypothetical protein
MTVTFTNQISIGLLDIWSWEIFWSQEPFGPRNLLVPGTFWSQEPFGPRNLLVPGTFWSQEPFGPRNLLAPGTFFVGTFLQEPY